MCEPRVPDRHFIASESQRNQRVCESKAHATARVQEVVPADNAANKALERAMHGKVCCEGCVGSVAQHALLYVLDMFCLENDSRAC